MTALTKVPATLAREIMGKNFFGVEEAIKYFGINPMEHQLAELAGVPFSEETLQACHDTHFLVAIFPISILDIWGMRPTMENGQELFYKQDWCRKEEFVEYRGKTGWKLIRKDPIEDFVSNTFREQDALLPEDEEMPEVQVVAYAVIGNYFLTGGQGLFKKPYVVCADYDSSGCRVTFGHFFCAELVLRRHDGEGRLDNTWLASVKKQ